MGKLYEEIFWLNRRRNGGSTSAGMVAQSKTEWWLNLSGLGAQRTPEYSSSLCHFYSFIISRNRSGRESMIFLLYVLCRQTGLIFDFNIPKAGLLIAPFPKMVD